MDSGGGEVRDVVDEDVDDCHVADDDDGVCEDDADDDDLVSHVVGGQHG